MPLCLYIKIEFNYIMNKVYLSDDIFYIENFIDEVDLQPILSFCQSEEDWNLWPHSIHLTKKINLDKKIKEVLDRYNDKFLSLIKNNEIMYVPDQVLKYKKSDDKWALYPHSDRENYSSDNSEIPIYGYVLYLNDDYEGGEMVYTDKNIILKPLPGTLLVHETSEECTHAVKKIISGDRFVMVGFIYSKNPD